MISLSPLAGAVILAVQAQLEQKESILLQSNMLFDDQSKFCSLFVCECVDTVPLILKVVEVFNDLLHTMFDEPFAVSGRSDLIKTLLEPEQFFLLLRRSF